MQKNKDLIWKWILEVLPLVKTLEAGLHLGKNIWDSEAAKNAKWVVIIAVIAASTLILRQQWIEWFGPKVAEAAQPRLGAILGRVQMKALSLAFENPMQAAKYKRWDQEDGSVRLLSEAGKAIQIAALEGKVFEGVLADLSFDRAKRQKSFEVSLVHGIWKGVLETQRMRIRFLYPQRTEQMLEAASLAVEWCKMNALLHESCEALNLGPDSPQMQVPFTSIASNDRIRMKIRQEGHDVHVSLQLLQLEQNRKRNAPLDEARGEELVYHFVATEEAPPWFAITFSAENEDPRRPLRVELHELIGISPARPTKAAGEGRGRDDDEILHAAQNPSVLRLHE